MKRNDFDELVDEYNYLSADEVNYIMKMNTGPIQAVQSLKRQMDKTAER